MIPTSLSHITEKINRITRVQKGLVLFIAVLIVIIGALVNRAFLERGRLRDAQYRAQVKLLTRATDYQANLPKIEKLAKDQPGSRPILMDLALAYYNTQQYEKAINAYKEVIALDGEYPSAYNGVANVYRDAAIISLDKDQKTRFFDEAEKYYRLAIKHDKTFVIAYSNLAQMLAEYVDRSIASMVIEEGLKNKQDSQELLNLRKTLAN